MSRLDLIMWRGAAPAADVSIMRSETDTATVGVFLLWQARVKSHTKMTNSNKATGKSPRAILQLRTT